MGRRQLDALTDQPNADPRALALTNKLTGYYRPEDMDIDRAARAQDSVRFCGTNTGNELNQWYGEVYCISDGTFPRGPPTLARHRSSSSHRAARR